MSGRAPEGPADAQTLFVPYVVCVSHDGDFDDAAFDAGVECGMIYAELAQCERVGATPKTRWIARRIAPQIDLFAMRFGYVLNIGPDEQEDWVRVAFARSDEPVC